MRDALNQLDTALFLLLNGLHAPWFDWLMVQCTARNTWIPFYALLVGWLGWRLGWRAVGVVLALVLVIVVSDQTCSAVLKPLTLRLRPCHETALQPLIHPVLPCGGLYGFASSHAANTMALAVFCWGLFGRRYRAFGWLFPWAIVVAYSRIYVGAHYPLDVLAGAGIGTLAGLGGVSLYHALAGAPLSPQHY